MTCVFGTLRFIIGLLSFIERSLYLVLSIFQYMVFGTD